MEPVVKFDLRALSLVMGLTFFFEFLAILMQYKINRVYRGIGWWLAGVGMLALGVTLTAAFKLPVVDVLARFGMPVTILGYLFLYVGLVRFCDKRENRALIASFYVIFLIFYNYYIYINNSISGRAIIGSGALAIILFTLSYDLFFNNHRGYRVAARFTGSAMLLQGCYLAVRVCSTLLAPPLQSYVDMAPIHVVAFLVPNLTSILWTFGFILMVNQRLNEDSIEDKETYQSILNASPDDITITDLQGRILLVSPAANAMFGYPRGAEIGRNLLEFIVPEDHPRARANLALMFQEDRRKPNDYLGVHRDGRLFDIEVNSGLIHDINGKPSRMVFIVRDISERRRAESERAELADKSRQLEKTESLGRMAGAIAHHFNNQLQGVMSNLDLIRGIPEGSDVVLRVAKAKQAVDRAALMSRLMLVYLGQASGSQVPRFLAEICRGALPELQAGLPATAHLEASLPESGPVISAAAALIQEALGNLVTNAWEALGGAQGNIKVELTSCPAADLPTAYRFPINWEPQAPFYACLAVADTGCGISAAELGKVFDPFFTTKFTGRGLGLSVVLGIVQAHGGAVAMESRPGQGTVVRAYFPECAAPHG